MAFELNLYWNNYLDYDEQKHEFKGEIGVRFEKRFQIWNEWGKSSESKGF